MLKWWSGITLVLVMHACTNDMRDVMRLPRNQLAPSQVGDSVTLLYSDTSHLRVMLQANRMLVFTKNTREPMRILPNGVFVTFFDNKGAVSATLRSNYAVHYEMTKRMEAKYKVEVVNLKGEKMETERLVWDEATEKISTDAPVKITTGNEVIRGIGLESNQDFSRYQIHQVTGVFHLEEEQPIKQ